jgi:hypothetical protein
MSKKTIVLILVFAGLVFFLESCRAGKGCGCGNNLNYYNPKKGR